MHRRRAVADPDGTLAERLGRLAFQPVWTVAHAGSGVLNAEAERAIDGVMAGPLPEAIGRALVEHLVVQRLAASALDAWNEQAESATAHLLDDADVERRLLGVVRSRRTAELAHEIVESPAFKQVLADVLSSAEVRAALSRQTVGFAGELAIASRRRSGGADDSIDAAVRRRLRRPAAESGYAGLATRGIALVADSLLVALVFLVGGALIGLVSSLFGTLRPTWLVGVLAGVGWLLVLLAYFVGFWSAVGQTPGMRLTAVRVVDREDAAPSVLRSAVRLLGLALAVIPLFAGFLPVFFDRRRRALPDFLAGTTVVYD